MDKADYTPIGTIWAATSLRGLVAIQIGGDQARFRQLVERLTGQQPDYHPERVSDVIQKIRAYLRGELRIFDLRIDWSTTISPFQELTLRTTCDIPYGRTSIYSNIAQVINKPGAARAVGQALATNPMPLVVPCHRVISADGQLQGYVAPDGVVTKEWLLRMEGALKNG